ncbi:hypothetical protein J2S55_003182 [Streptosporangium brasiliense]|uniref:Uncharacterized protein n=1 Tax=Streptosporangium brasiliense TaxID=47480 RepID=A0ABT9R4T8_9ACTN|nr:hypothetical protein [Streptosporangium brasiliense]
MTAVSVEIGARPVDKPEIEFIADLDMLVDSNKCSCSAGDDAPY